jgi:hypothetical protein
VDDPFKVKEDLVSAALLKHKTHSRLSSSLKDLEKGTTGQKLFYYKSMCYSTDRQVENQLPPPLYLYNRDLDLQLRSRYVYLNKVIL